MMVAGWAMRAWVHQQPEGADAAGRLEYHEGGRAAASLDRPPLPMPGPAVRL